MKKAHVKYIDSGAFQGDEEDVSLADIKRGEECVVVSKKTWKEIQESLKLLRSIAYHDDP